MQEVALSNDLTKLTTEIKTYQSIGGQAIFEIGRRLKWVKENDLAHGEYDSWLKEINTSRSQAHKFIKVAKEYSNVPTSAHLGINVLYEIATMPPDERDKPQTLESGETKKPDEMTVRELRETKKKLKERDKDVADRDAKINELSDKEPEIVEKVPDDYGMLQGMVENQKATIDRYIKDNSELREEIDDLQDQLTDRQPEQTSSLNDLLAEFIGKAFPLADSNEFVKSMNHPSQAKSIQMNIESIDKWCLELKERFKSSTVIEGDFTNEK
ncbi:DUF3102 domain-containing protein [Levilactobacillus brevis]|uniref:DUF3102 domain-containing protein n=1 Tax=Levilactobacillus brevis TaxID=1580 RepID=UPI00041A0387|nr:DUF3102 domain-containing protein [Levilactobacillus brevis]ATU69529.1 DUF3102 domain-containing protein [Levilactobacillus brevis]KID42895.1 Pathogenicity island SaPIn1 [Levilactobacillus brevis]